MKKISKYFALVISFLLITALFGCTKEKTELKKPDAVQEEIEISHKEETVEQEKEKKKEKIQTDEEKLVCDLLVDYSDIFEDISSLKKEKQEKLKEGGIILSLNNAEFTEGESVFDVLKRELDKAEVSLKYSKMSIGNNVYIEGIDDICEFDCGKSSGWLYRVNDEHPMLSSSQYKLKTGDKIHFIYKRKAY